MSSRWVLGIDIGGTGSRLIGHTLGDAPQSRTLLGPPVAVTPSGSNLQRVAFDLIASARVQWPDLVGNLAAVVVGATGLATLVSDPQDFATELQQRCQCPALVAIDALTAHVGALGGEPGAVISIGTGSIAISTSDFVTWNRVDGWGHLLGDRGGGVWIGMRGLEGALEHFDGLTQNYPELLTRAVTRFGPPLSWPAQFYTRDDRAGLLASFAQDVIELAQDGNGDAIRIVTRAAHVAARGLGAALGPQTPKLVSALGGIFHGSALFAREFKTMLQELVPEAIFQAPAGTGAQGAITLANWVGQGKFQGSHPPYYWFQPAALT